MRARARLDPHGRYAHTIGGALHPGTPTLPQLLSDHGYHAAALGKMHFNPARGPYGFEHLWDATHGGAMILEKEFWQQAERMVGFCDGYELFGEARYFDALENIWRFVRQHMIHDAAGEWRTLLDRDGRVIDGHLGNPWKVAYHSGRAMLECLHRLARLRDAGR